MSRNTFSALGVNSHLVTALENDGINQPFPIQQSTLPDAIAGKDILGKGQTGSGKTLAFGLAVLTRLAGKRGRANQPLALILAPTRELAMQINEVLGKYGKNVGIQTTVLAGGMPYPPQLKALKAGAQVVVATPGRLQDHLKRGTVDLSTVRTVVLDEADQMADMGFLPVVTEVLALTPADGQRLLFSATLDNDVNKIVNRFMKDPVSYEVPVDETRKVDMDHHVLVVDSHVKEEVLAQIAAREGRTIFFVRTKHGADKLTDKLREQGVDVGVLHGGRTQKQRSRVLDAFKIGRKKAIIATDVAARGIHVDDVSLVVHVDPAENHKDYLHRAGRTARAGAKGTVVSIASTSNRKRIHRLGKSAGVDMVEAKIDSLHPELIRITGAKKPSGVRVDDEPLPRAERSKPGRSSRGGGRKSSGARKTDNFRGGRKSESEKGAPKSRTKEDSYSKPSRPSRPKTTNDGEFRNSKPRSRSTSNSSNDGEFRNSKPRSRNTGQSAGKGKPARDRAGANDRREFSEKRGEGKSRGFSNQKSKSSSSEKPGNFSKRKPSNGRNNKPKSRP